MNIRFAIGSVLFATVAICAAFAMLGARPSGVGSVMSEAPKAVQGVLPRISDASAHRTHGAAYAAYRMRQFIREYQCKGDGPGPFPFDPIPWACDQTIQPFAIPFGNHSWRWSGAYYIRGLTGNTAICQTSGVYVDHDIKLADGTTFALGDHIYNATRSGAHC